jgi:subtilisin family serine protease
MIRLQQHSRILAALSPLTMAVFAVFLTACGSGSEEAALFELFTAGTDPFFEQQWHLQNTGQKSFSSSGGVAGEDLNLQATHAASILGAGVRVAVSDTGVEINHEDLVDRILAGESRDYGLASPYIGDPTPNGSADASAHGTAVAGIIAATGWNGIGTRGVAPLALLAGFRFIGVDLTIAEVLDQAEGDFDVFNYSYGVSSCSFAPMETGLLETLQSGGTSLRGGLGAVYVKSAGNEYAGDLEDCSSASAGIPYFGNSNLDESNTVPEVVVTAALNADGVSASYSSPGSNLWVSAPGGEFGLDTPAIVTSDLTGCTQGFATSAGGYTAFDGGESGNGNCDYTNTMNGTSSSAPMVSGVVALLMAAKPELSWRDIKYILARTATQVDATAASTSHPLGEDLTGHTYQDGWVTNGAGRQFHNWYGFGGVDVDAAVEMARNYAFPLGTYIELPVVSSGSIHVALPDRSATGANSTLAVSTNIKIESVVVTASVTHTAASDLGIELTSPMGTKAILMNINSHIMDSSLSGARFLANAFLDEDSSGTWTLKVIDGASVDTGALTRWSIQVNGHAP